MLISQHKAGEFGSNFSPEPSRRRTCRNRSTGLGAHGGSGRGPHHLPAIPLRWGASHGPASPDVTAGLGPLSRPSERGTELGEEEWGRGVDGRRWGALGRGPEQPEKPPHLSQAPPSAMTVLLPPSVCVSHVLPRSCLNFFFFIPGPLKSYYWSGSPHPFNLKMVSIIKPLSRYKTSVASNQMQG